MSQATAIFEKLPFARTLSDQVAQALLARIESGQLKPGEKLPPEAVPAPEFGVSRTVVREAISRLKHGGSPRIPQIVEGDLSVKLREQIARIGHIQVAGVPDRHEPDEGKVNYPYLFRLVDELGIVAGSAANTGLVPEPVPASAGCNHGYSATTCSTLKLSP